MLTDREKAISKFVDSIIIQEEWDKNKKKHINYLKKKFNNELDKYTFINSINELKKLKLGGYIRYINMNDEFKCGGILCKINYDHTSMNHIIVISNINNGNKTYYNVSFEKNYVFYRNHITKEDKTRELFISHLDYTEDL
jgi:hypothetical protein